MFIEDDPGSWERGHNGLDYVPDRITSNRRSASGDEKRSHPNAKFGKSAATFCPRMRKRRAEISFLANWIVRWWKRDLSEVDEASWGCLPGRDSGAKGP
jgi:hypothetical protein